MKTLRTRITTLLAVSLFLLGACASSDTTAPKAPDEAAAVAALKEINRAQEDFIRRTRRYAQTFDELTVQHLLNAEPTVETTGYSFLLRPSPDAVSYTVAATPSALEARHFFTDQTGVIRSESGKPATSTSPGM
jgi:hypothetical protein